jgi:IclR family acetate operon transcriptional repressor
MMKPQNAGPVKSAARALDIVETIGARGPLNARAISRAIGAPESSLSYLLATLVDREWLEPQPDRTYGLGPALARLASGRPPTLAERARIQMRALTALTGETTSLFIRRGDEIETLEVEHSAHELRFTPQRGSRMPLHSFAAGKALLARMAPAELAAYFARGGRARFTDRTLTEEPDLRADLERCRKAGYAISREEHSPGVIGVAMALDEAHSLSVAIPSPRFDPEAEQRIVDALKDAYAAIAS